MQQGQYFKERDDGRIFQFYRLLTANKTDRPWHIYPSKSLPQATKERIVGNGVILKTEQMIAVYREAVILIDCVFLYHNPCMVGILVMLSWSTFLALHLAGNFVQAVADNDNSVISLSIHIFVLASRDKP